MILVPILFILLLFIWGIWIFISIYFNGSNHSFSEIINRVKIYCYLHKNVNNCYEILFSKNSYFQKLSPDNQLIFIKRIKKFILHKEFVPVQMTSLTIENKIHIASSAIQISFGIDEYIFERFHTIKVYPSHFENNSKTANHKGEVNLNGEISLSLIDFEAGYKKYNDGINLGLHEMAHALTFNQLLEKDEDNFFNSYYRKFEIDALKELKNPEENSLIRKYGKTNIHEFFAVCVENFFERPVLFKNELPEIYDHLVLLLNQNPLSNNLNLSNFRVVQSNETNIPGEIIQNYQYSINYIVLVFFGSFALFTIQSMESFFTFLFTGLIITILKTTKLILTKNGLITKKLISKKDVFIDYKTITHIRLDSSFSQSKIQIRHQVGEIIQKTITRSNLNSRQLIEFKKIIENKKIIIYYDNQNLKKS